MELEINKELVLSTAHIREVTAKALEQSSAGISCDVYEYGFRIHVSKYVTPYEELNYLLNLAKSHECKWLVLDQDAETYFTLPQYEW